MGLPAFGLVLACAVPPGTAGAEGSGERSQAPGAAQGTAMSCRAVPEGVLAHLADAGCGQVLVRAGGTLELRSLVDAPEQADDPVWSGKAPSPCAESECRFELVATRLGVAVLAGEASRGVDELGNQQWLLGPVLDSLASNTEDAPVRHVPLWGGERIRVDSSDFGPTYELELWQCAEDSLFRLVGREPSADLADAPQSMRVRAAEPSRFDGSPVCERIRLPTP